MRSASYWFIAGIVAMLAGAVGARALSPDEPRCVLGDEAGEAGVGARADPAHISHDLEEVRTAADRFALAVSRRPVISDSPDALAGAQTAPQRARTWCEETLLTGIARRHALDLAALWRDYDRSSVRRDVPRW